MRGRYLGIVLVSTLAAAGLASTADPDVERPAPEVRHSVRNDVSPPLSVAGEPVGEEPDREEYDIEGGNAPVGEGDPDKEQPDRTRVLPRPRITGRGSDPVAQRSEFSTRRRAPIAPSAPIPGTEFDSLGDNWHGFFVNSAPPDTSMAVGLDQIVVMVNSGIVVQNKSGAILDGPFASNSLWDGFGGECENQNDGDGIVRYDRLADRWIVSQFAVSGDGYYECIAVSTSDDATGSYYRYAFEFDDFPDFPKLSVWPDAYYVTYNMFDDAGDWVGSKVCAANRNAMLAGQNATQICEDAGDDYGGLLAADVDSEIAPPLGAPNPVVSIGYYTDELAYWKFHVDFAQPNNSILDGPYVVDVATYFPACYISGVWYVDCIDQKDTAQGLDALDDRLMNRLAYRNFGDRQSVVVTQSVRDTNRVGVRWYELQIDSDSNLSLDQQGTYVPDTDSRWMPSAALDQSGNIAIGYSKSSATMFPSIAYTGRLAEDVAGILTQGETITQAGGGSQTGEYGLSRWGDYSTMNIDPADDCTFWFATEYLPNTGEFNWATSVSSFRLPNCFSVQVDNDVAVVRRGGSQDISVAVGNPEPDTGTVELDIDGLPDGVTADFSDTEFDDDGTATLTLSASATATLGSAPITIQATGNGVTRETNVDLNVTDFGFSISPGSVSTTVGGTVNGTFSSVLVPGRAQNVMLSASGAPTGARITFSRSRVAAGARGTFRVTTGSNTPAGIYRITLTATGTSSTISRSFLLTVADFSVIATPSSASKARSTTQAITVDTEVTAGATQPLTLSVGRLPRGVTARFSSTRVNAGSSPTLTLSIGATARPGTYTIAVSARGTTKTKTANINLTITG